MHLWSFFSLQNDYDPLHYLFKQQEKASMRLWQSNLQYGINRTMCDARFSNCHKNLPSLELCWKQVSWQLVRQSIFATFEQNLHLAQADLTDQEIVFEAPFSPTLLKITKESVSIDVDMWHMTLYYWRYQHTVISPQNWLLTWKLNI